MTDPIAELIILAQSGNLENDRALMKLGNALADELIKTQETVKIMQEQMLEMVRMIAMLQHRQDALLTVFYTHFDQPNKQ